MFGAIPDTFNAEQGAANDGQTTAWIGRI